MVWAPLNPDHMGDGNVVVRTILQVINNTGAKHQNADLFRFVFHCVRGKAKKTAEEDDVKKSRRNRWWWEYDGKKPDKGERWNEKNQNRDYQLLH